MASSHPPYPHPGPSYYNPPPPHQITYGSQPAPYYQYPIPPMNGHPPGNPPTSPRTNAAGRGRYNPHGGGVPSYQLFQPMHSPQNVPPPPTMQSPPISPVSPYPHSQKHPPHLQQVPYSPMYPSQPSGSYASTWPGETMSPLPKQLTMLPPVQQLPSSSQVQISSESVLSPLAPPPPVTHEVTKPPPPPFHPSSPPDTSRAHETITSQSLLSPSKSVPSIQSVRIASPISGWVIWSHRPHDPSHAPGIIISPSAYPPEDVVLKALDFPSPPVSPRLRSLELPLQQIVHAAADLQSMHDISEETSDMNGAPSSSATETTPASSTPADTPVPGSPLSSNTSVSIAAASPSVTASKTLSSPAAETKSEGVTAEPVPVETAPSAAPTGAAPPATTVPPAPKPAAVKKSWASLLQSSDAAASSSKSRLPVSSVVGFSIPAATFGTPTGTGSSVSAGNKYRQDLVKLITSGLPSSNVPLKICPRGLVNTGNMCFANSVLQVLIYCAPFHRLFAELGKHLSGPVVGPQKEGTKATPLIDAVIQFMKEFLPPSSQHADTKMKGKERGEEAFYEPESFVPTYVYDAMKEKKRFANMIGGHQEDAEEFLGFFLDTLEEELLSLVSQTSKEQEEEVHEDGWLEVGKRNRLVVTRTVKSTDSPITRIFGGKFRSTLQAPHQKDSVIIEDWRSLRLDIQREQVHTIKDALQSISQKQPVQITSPTRPGVVLEAQQQALIEFLPPILILHLKRFHYDTNVGDVVKIGKQIAFGPELDIGPDLIAPNHRTPHPVKYQLFGVLYHHGLSASGGHYTLDVLHANRDLSDRPRAAWIRIDDELVSDIRPEDVFNSTERDDRCAYLLFYRRMSGLGAPRT